MFICVHLWLVFLTSCGSKPTDVRTLIPADALIYLESSDLRKVLDAVADRPAFRQLAKAEPDFSALDGIQLAVAVTGFQTSEQEVTEENSIGEIQPRFVAVAETNAWGWQTNSFAENKLGGFIVDTYGGEVEVEISSKHDGKYYVWTSQDGRKTYALVQGSVIFFGNDESAIEKCLAVKRGEADSIAKNPKINGAPDRLAFALISTDGIGQVANLVGVSLAMDASEEGEVKSFIARVLPEILRNSVEEFSWTATKTERGIEDRMVIRTNPEVAGVLNATLVPTGESAPNTAEFMPNDAISVSRYNLKDPQIAWRSVVLTAQKQTDSMSGSLISGFSGSVFEPYGIEDTELFLNSVGNQIFTVTFDLEGENAVAIASIKSLDSVKRAIAKEINFAKPPENIGGADIWKSEDGEIAAAFFEGKVISGDAESVLRCLQAKQNGNTFVKNQLYGEFSNSNAIAVTVTSDQEAAARIVAVLSEPKDPAERVPVNYLTETRFNQNGIERRVVSDFGLIGAIIEQFGKD